MKLRSESEGQIIIRLLSQEVDRLKKELAKAEKEEKEDPLKELLDVRQAAAGIINNKSLTPKEISHRLGPFVAREKRARLKIKMGWCITKAMDKKYEILHELERAQTLLADWQWREGMRNK